MIICHISVYQFTYLPVYQIVPYLTVFIKRIPGNNNHESHYRGKMVTKPEGFVTMADTFQLDSQWVIMR